MSFGEATLEELLDIHKELLAESEELLGAKIYHLAPTKEEVTRDRLGGVKKIAVVAEPELINGGSVVFNPTEEMLKKWGIQEQVGCVITLAESNLPSNFNRMDSRFLIGTNFDKKMEFKIKTVSGIGQVGNEYVYLAIGLVVK